MSNELQHIIDSKRELLRRETVLRSPINYSAAMPSDQKDRYIRYLIESQEEKDLELRAMRMAVEEFQSIHDRVSESLANLQKEMADIKRELSSERSKRKSAESRARKLDQQLKFAQKNRFGDKRQNARKKPEKPDEECDRNNEKDGFDGTAGTLSTGSVAASASTPSSASAKKERDTSNRPDNYNTMSVTGTPVIHPSDESKVPGRIIGKKNVKVFSFKMCLVEEQFEMIHYVERGKKPAWGDFPKEGHPQAVTRFEGTKATPEFLQAIAYEVYVKNVTFGLLHEWLTDLGMTVSANTLRNWLKKGKKYLDQLIVVLKSIALEKDSIVNCDETWCKVRKYDRYKKCYIWVLVNKSEKIAIFFYEDGSRGRKVLTDFLGDAELKSVMTDGYNAYVFIGDELKSAHFKDTEHQVCMAHSMAKFAKAANPGGDKVALPFHDDMGLFYKLEDRYDKEGISLEERGRRRQSLETKEIMMRLRMNLKIELDKADTERSPYLTEALHYLDKFWDGIFAFTKDGNYPIDNNLAERTIRKLTTQRNSMLHFGSDEGVEMAAAYHSVISTVKLHGMSSWHYLGELFQKIFNGCRDFLSMTPQNIGLAYSKC